MAHVTSAERPTRHRLGLLLICCVLLLVAAGCGDDDSVFSTNPDGSPNTQATLPGGLGGEDDPGDGSIPAGEGNSPGGSAAAIPASAQVYAGVDLTALGTCRPWWRPSARPTRRALTEGLGDTAGQAVGDGHRGPGSAGLPERGLGDRRGQPARLDRRRGRRRLVRHATRCGERRHDRPQRPGSRGGRRPGRGRGRPPRDHHLPGDLRRSHLPETDYQGVTVYRADPGDGGAAHGRSPSSRATWCTAMGAGMVEQAIDLGDGASLADDPNFSEVLAALPDGRHLRATWPPVSSRRWSAPWPERPASRAALPFPTSSTRPSCWRGCEASAWRPRCSTRACASRWWGWVNAARPWASTWHAAGDMAGLLPADAIGLRRDRGLRRPRRLGLPDGDAGADARGRRGQPSVDDTITMVGTMLGIDIEQDLVNQLTGEMGLGLLPATAGSLVTGSGDQPGPHRRVGRAGPGRHGHHRPGPGHRPRPPVRGSGYSPALRRRHALCPVRRHQRHRPLRHGRRPHGDHHPREPRRRPPGRGRPARRVGPLCRSHQRPARRAATRSCTSTSPPWSAL